MHARRILVWVGASRRWRQLVRFQSEQKKKTKDVGLEYSPFRGIKMGRLTGPVTPRGRARSSQNAAKHWVVSKRILPGEQQEAAILRNGFTKDFNPEGSIENEVIEDLVFNRLMKRRVDVAITRAFSKAAIEKSASLVDIGERSAVQFWLPPAEVRGTNRREREPAERLRPDLCIAALKILKGQISDHGPQPEHLAALRRIYGDQPTEHAAKAMHQLLLLTNKEGVQDQKGEAAFEEVLKNILLDTLQTEIELQKNREEFANEISAVEFATDVQEPARPALEILLRYRAANTREFRELLDSLERIRRLRQSSA
jgi:hypothetical protein